METELERDRERETEREAQRAKERADAQRQQLEERRQREKAEIEAKNLSESERGKLLEQHEKNMAKYEQSLNDELQRNTNALEAKLNARRNRRKAGEQSRIEKEDILREEERKRKELLGAMQAAAISKQQQELLKKQAAAATASTSQAPAAGPFAVSGGTGTGGEQDWMAMLMASPLFQQISDIHEMLEKNSGPGMGPDFVLGKVGTNFGLHELIFFPVSLIRGCACPFLILSFSQHIER